MVDIKKLCERLSVDEMTAKSILESFFKELGNKYRDSSTIEYLLNNNCGYFNYNGSVEKFRSDYNEKFHPIVKAYIDELVNSLVVNAKSYGARIYKPYWEDNTYYESQVRTESRLNREIIEFCELTNASDEVLTAIFNMATEKLTELGIAWGSIDEFPGACSDEPYYLGGSQWVFQSYEEFKRIMARELYHEGESMFGWELYDIFKKDISEKDKEIVIHGNYEFSELSTSMTDYLRELVGLSEWVGNEKLYAYASKFKLELSGFGYGCEDEYVEIIAEEFIDKVEQYVGKDFVQTCRFLMHETQAGNDYCYLKYEKRFDDLSESEKEIVLTKVINECFDMIQRK